jgi:hypothetical protein
MPRTDILERKEEILQWIAENQSKAFICRQLKCKPETLNSYLEKMGIFYEGNKGLKGIKVSNNYKTAKEYSKGVNVKSHILKQKLIRDGLKKNNCEICGVSIWQGVQLPLELHHKDGNHFNNDFDNLQILCPNCHSIQEGNCGANVGKYTSIENEEKEPLENKEKIRVFCIDCGKEISSKATRCKSCAAKQKARKVENRPSREELKELIRKESFLQIGKIYGVSDNSIRKWCKLYNLPSKKIDINNYSDEDWSLI